MVAYFWENYLIEYEIGSIKAFSFGDNDNRQRKTAPKQSEAVGNQRPKPKSP
jgi:hypothetical protein